MKLGCRISCNAKSHETPSVMQHKVSCSVPSHIFSCNCLYSPVFPELDERGYTEEEYDAWMQNLM